MEENRSELKWVRHLMCFPHVPQSWFRQILSSLSVLLSVCYVNL
jgi:hypothetical protein